MARLAVKGGKPVRTEHFPVWPVWGDEEIQNLTNVVKSGKWGCLSGTRTAEFEQQFATYQHARHGICVNSGTTALRLALTAADVSAGDEVIVPAYTFIATASAVIDMGGIPVFVDIDPETYNMDVKAAEQAITERTRAIMPVHFAGRPIDMDAVLALAKKHDLKIVEDAAQAWGAEWKGNRLGAMGDVGCFSFQASKNINAGEGGIIITNDDVVAKMARSHNNCGRSEDGLWYEHFYFGGNTRMTEFQAAVLQAQFARYDGQKEIRQGNLAYLNEKLGEIEGIEPLADDENITSHASHLYIFKYIKKSFANKPKENFIEAMQQEGIPTSTGYSLPLYKQPVFLNKAFGPRGKTVD
ncbi:MAG: aminotransferase class I/II-fold pyridoxal phosphate-dependent enzyme, partial [Actinobacteria bacterium]|nr:aminotransferase class I/II-fold pyridoxal phosphate-dependent enzyme [Actinomycetota bacterium]